MPAPRLFPSRGRPGRRRAGKRWSLVTFVIQRLQFAYRRADDTDDPAVAIPGYQVPSAASRAATLWLGHQRFHDGRAHTHSSAPLQRVDELDNDWIDHSRSLDLGTMARIGNDMHFRYR